MYPRLPISGNDAGLDSRLLVDLFVSEGQNLHALPTLETLDENLLAIGESHGVTINE